MNGNEMKSNHRQSFAAIVVVRCRVVVFRCRVAVVCWAIGLGVCVSGIGNADPPPAIPAAADTPDLFQVADQLSDPRYLVRSDAARQLRSADRQAVPAVVHALKNGNLETLIQGMRILRHIAATHPPDNDGGAYQALEEMSQWIGVTESQTRMAIAEIRQVRSRSAAEALQAADAYLGPGGVTILSVNMQLELLFLGDSFVDQPENLRWLRWLDGVENVALQSAAINASVARALSGMRNLKRLFLSEGSIDRPTLMALTELKHLDVLEVHYVAVDPADVDVVSAIEINESLTLNGTGLPNDASEVVRQANFGLQFDFKRGGFLGVMCSSQGGCLVSDVVQGSGADQAGLMPGDEIVRVNDATVAKFDDLKNEISKFEVGQTVEVEFVRDFKASQTKMLLKKHEGYEIRIPDQIER